MSGDELDELLALYAFGAASDTERARVEQRAAEDPIVRARLGEFEETVRLIAHEIGPPDHVWERLAAAVFPGVPRVPDPRQLVNRVIERRPRSRRILAGLGAVACVAALVAGVIVASSGGSSTPNLSAVAASARRAPGARLADLDRSDGTVAASVVVLPTGAGYLTSRLVGLPAGRTYQLWAQTATGAVSLGVLGPNPRVVAFTLVGEATRLMVTNERAGGVPQSHQTPTAVWAK